MTSERNESLDQEIKDEVYFGDESNYCYCSCGSFWEKGCMKNIIGELDANINQLTRIVGAEICRQQQNDSLVERPKTREKRKSKTNLKVLPNKRKKHPYSERVGTKADIMKQYYKAKISFSQMMQISSEKYKALLVNNKEDDVTKIIITNKNKNSDDLKIAKVTLVFKAGNNTELSNYRPISVLPCFSKILECVIYNRLHKYLLDSNIL